MAGYKDEIAKCIKGESSFDQDVLNELYTECKDRVSAISLEISEAEQRILMLNEAAETFKQDYCKVLSWAEAYKGCSTEGKKMIIRQLIKKICVSRDYALKIELNLSYKQFEKLMGPSAGALEIQKNSDDLLKVV